MSAEVVHEHRLTLQEVVGWLIEDGMVDRAAGDKLVAERRLFKGGVHPLVLVADQEWRNLKPPEKTLTLEDLTVWLAERVGMAYVKIDPLKVDFSIVTEVMSSAYATRFKIVPLQMTTKEVVVASAEPYIREWQKELQPILKREIRTQFANPADIERYLVEFYNLARSVKKAAKTGSGASGTVLVRTTGRTRQDQQAVRRQRPAHRQYCRLAVAVRIRTASPTSTSSHGASWRSSAFASTACCIRVPDPRIRCDSDDQPHQAARPHGPDRKRRPQDGRIKTRTPDGQETELRLSTLPTAFGEKLVMRVFDPDVLVRDFRDLGFSDDDLARWNSMTTQPNGIILVTGPTGSGKTTTLYSTLKKLATPEVNVCTIEDPIEMIEPSFNQMQVQQAIDLGFADGVRSLMRQDPDIIMVGEIRDYETADMAIQAALTGHLVLSTLHTNDAPSAITRMLDLGVPPYLLTSTVLGVMAQRLVRTLCPACKKEGGLRAEDEEHWNQLVAPWKASRPRLYQPVGCLDCRMTGYSGRIGIYEVMLMSQEMKKLIRPDTDIARLREQAYREGMKALRISGRPRLRRADDAR